MKTTMPTVLACVAALVGAPAFAQAPPAQGPVWTKTKVMTCAVEQVHSCKGSACETRPNLPSFRIDIKKQTLCGLVAGNCRSEIKIGEVGLDGGGTRMTIHALGVAFVVGINADGAMNGADVVNGRVVVIQGRCVAAG